MYTYNEKMFRCPLETAFRLACEVELWPERLPHYRATRFRAGDGVRGGVVEMAAFRPFRLMNWPVRWVSEMEIDDRAHAIRYRHIEGVTTGMDVEWRFEPEAGAVKVSIVHRWERPARVRGLAKHQIGRLFVHPIADRTLEGLSGSAEDVRAKAVARYG